MQRTVQQLHELHSRHRRCEPDRSNLFGSFMLCNTHAKLIRIRMPLMQSWLPQPCFRPIASGPKTKCATQEVHLASADAACPDVKTKLRHDGPVFGSAHLASLRFDQAAWAAFDLETSCLEADRPEHLRLKPEQRHSPDGRK